MVRQAHHERHLAHQFSSFVVPMATDMIDCEKRSDKVISNITTRLLPPMNQGRNAKWELLNSLTLTDNEG